MELDTSLQYIKGVGPKLVNTLLKVDLKDVKDALFYFPRQYEDRRTIPKIAEAKKEDSMFFVGTVLWTKKEFTGNRKKIFKIGISDGTGDLSCIFFNQHFLSTSIKAGKKVFVKGKVEFNRFDGKYNLQVSEHEVLSKTDNLNVGRILPVYNLTQGLVQKKIRTIVADCVRGCLASLSDYFLPDFKEQNNLITLKEAVYKMHYPKDRVDYTAARRRIVFDEFFFMQLMIAKKRYVQQKNVVGISFHKETLLYQKYLDQLPYELTNAQHRVIQEVFADMTKDKPMNRLVQGDVGSGKTEIAVAALMNAVENGYQAAFMAPTEILAWQHYEKISKLLTPLGIRVEFLAGKLKKKQKETVKDYLASNMVDVVIGTHALIQDTVSIPYLGLAIVDEQHRFGVVQRAKLASHNQSAPDILVMTATPIPRSLTLTVYGDLDKSIIDEMPPGRKKIQTYWKRSPSQVYEFIRERLKNGEQVYYVLPLVEESDKIDLKAATEVFDSFTNDIFPEHKVGLIHGKLKPRDKEAVMESFRKKEINILVATTVIEVGIDVPNASVMVIEHSERFGLSQLHQLRGRVGRGTQESFCVLVSASKSQDAKKRMEVMCGTSDGFKIAEEDLAIRGPGDYFGTKQSGVPSLIMGDIVKDEKLLVEARNVAVEMIYKDPELESGENAAIKKELTLRSEYLLGHESMN